jgi:hypothetical protein
MAASHTQQHPFLSPARLVAFKSALSTKFKQTGGVKIRTSNFFQQ